MYMTETPEEIGVVELRKRFAEVIRDIEMRGRAYYITNNGRRVAKLSPLRDEKLSEEDS